MGNYFFDMLHMHQDFNFEIPIISDRHSLIIDTETKEIVGVNQPTIKHEGSYTTSVNIRISGNRITMTGNPSRINRLDNLFGLKTLDECVHVFNEILRSLSLPEFTKCTRTWQLTGNDGSKVKLCSDGAVVEELHITTNRYVGRGNEDDYLRGLSGLRYRNMVPRIHTNGKTADWLSCRGGQSKASSLIYASAYHKAHEIEVHALPKILKKYGADSDEYKYLKQVVDYCRSSGVVRFEQKLKSAFIRKHRLQFYGLSDLIQLTELQQNFLDIDQKLQVINMTIEGISERLIRLDICNGTRAANITALYALQWMHGQKFDFEKTQVRTHRARLRKVGIDIKDAFNVSRHSPVFVRKAREITVSDLSQPSWYREAKAPSHLRLIA